MFQFTRDISRKDLLGGLGAGAALFVAGPLCSEGGHDAHGGDKLTLAATHCVAVGEECMTHCLDSLAQGDTMLAGCAERVRDTITACQALAGFSAAKSSHLKAYIPVCRKICEECKEECLKHADHHEICKKCADACQDCIDAMAA